MMREICRIITIAGAAFLAGFALEGQAQVEEDLARPPPIPEESGDYQPLAPEEEGDVPIPPKIQEEQVEPTVRIIEEEDRRIEEYRRNGQVYMVRVVPKKGPPYYYIDTDGDGTLELDPSQKGLDQVRPVHWKVKEWD